MANIKIITKELSTQPEVDKPEIKQNHVFGDIVICLNKDKFYTIPIGEENDSLDS